MIVLAAVVLVILLLLSRLFTGPNSSTGVTGTPGATTTITATIALTPGAPTAVALSNVSVRSGPGDAYPVIGILPAGSSAAIIGRTDAAIGGCFRAPTSRAARAGRRPTASRRRTPGPCRW